MSVRHTKIIATIGPASSEPAILDHLITAGVDIVRLNFSHGTQADHAAKFHMVREAAKRAKRHVAILQDLSGPKIRIGRLAGGQPIPLERGEPLVVAIGEAVGGPGRVYTTYAELALKVTKGDRLLIDDGKIELEVESASAAEIHTRVIDGGELGEHKGINAPHVPLRSDMTEKDRRDLAFGLALGVDMVALSFVQAAADITRARKIMIEAGRPKVPIVAKLERPEAIDHLEEILDTADAGRSQRRGWRGRWRRRRHHAVRRNRDRAVPGAVGRGARRHHPGRRIDVDVAGAGRRPAEREPHPRVDRGGGDAGPPLGRERHCCRHA